VVKKAGIGTVTLTVEQVENVVQQSLRFNWSEAANQRVLELVARWSLECAGHFR
jgi:hypothetical protein